MDLRLSTESEFIKLSSKFLFINYNGPDNEHNVEDLNMLLNDLNSLDYKRHQITDSRLVLRLIDSFPNLPTDEDTIIVKACCLLKSLVSRRNILLNLQQKDNLLKWITKCLDNCFYSILCDAFNVVQMLMKGSLECIEKHCDKYISPNGYLTKLLQDPYYNKNSERTIDTNSPHEIYLSTMLCIEAILATSSVEDEENEDNLIPVESLESIGNSILDILYKIDVKDYTDHNYFVIITSSINCLKFISLQNNLWCTEKLGEILGVTKAFLMYGLPNIVQMVPVKIMISQQAILDPQSLQRKADIKIIKPRKTRTTQQRKNKKKNENNSANNKTHQSSGGGIDKISLDFNAYRTSDSDFSETEMRRAQIDLHKQAKLRYSVLSLIATIAHKVEKKILFGYWHSLFPYENLTTSTTSLLNSVIRDPSSRCRMTALQATSFMLQNAKPFLFQAESNEKTSTFTPFSVALGNMIISMYDSLTQALFNESDSCVLTQILKCFSIFIQATPFHRLKPGIITNFVKYMRYLVRQKNPNLKVGALMVMSCLLSASEITPEISQIFGSSNLEYKKLNDVKNVNELIEMEYDDEELEGPDDEAEDLNDSNKREDQESNSESLVAETSNVKLDFHISWVLQAALENLGVKVSQFVRPPINNFQTVRMECLQVLLVMSAHFILLKDHLHLIALALINSFNDAVLDIQLYGAKVLDALGESIINHIVTEEAIKLDEFNKFFDFWQTILPHVLQQIQNIQLNAKQRIACCDCIGNLGVYIYEKLPRNQQIQIISILSGCGCDASEVTVQGSAVRALSIYSIFPSLKTDMCFIENTTECCLKLIKHNNLAIRITASWSMGNIVDTLVSNIVNSAESNEKINDKLLQEIFEVSMVASADNDKVRSNVMRMIGNLLRLMNNEYLATPLWSEASLKLMEHLVSNAQNCNDFKVKWNACHAIGNFMKNPIMFEHPIKNKWQIIVYPALCDIITNLSNFKVRINAAAALIVPNERSAYGSYYLKIWSSALSALDQSNNYTDFNEYKHRDNLQEQLCTLLAHLINLAGPNDLVDMNNELIPIFETTKQNWYRVNNRILPEKSTLLLTKLNAISKTNQLSIEQKSSIMNMNSCFEIFENF